MKQQGLVMVFALLVLLSITVLGVSAVTSSLSQSKMAVSMQQSGLAFDAARGMDAIQGGKQLVKICLHGQDLWTMKVALL